MATQVAIHAFAFTLKGADAELSPELYRYRTTNWPSDGSHQCRLM
jgi:hypothetical protein